MEEENKVRKFKLIDKQGYLSHNPFNKGILESVNSNVFSGYINWSGELVNKDISIKTLIGENEFKFFEEIFDEQETPAPEESLYWKENQPLTAGLIVGKKCSGDREFFVKYVGDTYVVLADKQGEYTSTITNLKSMVKSDKDVIFDEVLSVWKRQSLDNAHDGKSSIVHLESFFDIVYHVIKGEG